MIFGKHDVVTVVAGQDLDTMQYKIVGVGGTIVATADLALGVNLRKPKSGEHASVGWMGHMKAYAAAAIVITLPITVTTSGFMINVTSGDGVSTPVGMPLVAANSGDLFEFVGNFALAKNTVV